jgi:NAD-dependent SIR2 family protein deacetylase
MYDESRLFSEQAVLFLGAGCSVSCGLPQWGGLLEDLAKEAKMNDTERKALLKLNYLDQARILEKRLGSSDALNRSVSKRLQGHVHGVLHAILQSLPINEVITTNYDKLFEQACAEPISVLPWCKSESQRSIFFH